MNRPRIIFAAACLVLAALIGVFALTVKPSGPHKVTESGKAAIGGPFVLVDQDGKAVNQEILKGKWTAVFFGYTFCPDACPTTLQTLGAAQDLLGPKAKNFQVVLITIDPARDKPEVLKTYLTNQGFPKSAIGLSGSPAQVARAAAAYRVYYAKVGEGTDDYLMDHSTAIYLMNPKGEFVKVIPEGVSPDQAAELIRGAMRGR